MMAEIRDENGKNRHKEWLAAIEEGKFSFGSEVVSYTPFGNGSWIHEALGIEDETIDNNKLQYNSEFLNSDWKLFYDALQEHRFRVIHVILPKYGICVA